MRASAAADLPVSVIVLGMHRSGTSAVCRILRGLGIFGGREEEMLAADSWNPRGYSELRSVVALNDELYSLHGYHLTLPPLELEHALAKFGAPGGSREGGEGLRKSAASLAREFSERGGGQWVWKDPRFCITLPWWRGSLGRVIPILCLRHPSAIADSLVRRDGFARRGSLDLWEAYLRQALFACRDLEFLPLEFEELVREPASAVGRLAEFLGARGVRLGSSDGAAELLEPGLIHSAAADDSELDARQRRLLELARRGEADVGFLHETQAACRGHRTALLDITVRALDAELARAREEVGYRRQQERNGLEELAYLREREEGFHKERAYLQEQERNAREELGYLREQERNARNELAYRREQEENLQKEGTHLREELV